MNRPEKGTTALRSDAHTDNTQDDGGDGEMDGGRGSPGGEAGLRG